MQARINQVTIKITKGDILSVRTDAIVHETDSGLSVADKWAKAAGNSFVHQTNMIGWCDIGAAVIADAGELDAKKVIHAVGPRWGDTSARGKLANVTWELLQIAEDNGMTSIIIPPISTGANGYPVENCAKIMMEQIVNFTFEPLKHLHEIVICLSTDEEEIAFRKNFQQQIDSLKGDNETNDIVSP